VDGQYLKLAGFFQAIRVRFSVELEIRERVGCQTDSLFDVETLGWGSVTYNRVFARFAAQKFPMAH
jgi:hypothetical protein